MLSQQKYQKTIMGNAFKKKFQYIFTSQFIRNILCISKATK